MLRTCLFVVGTVNAIQAPNIHDLIQGAIHAQTEAKTPLNDSTDATPTATIADNSAPPAVKSVANEIV